MEKNSTDPISSIKMQLEQVKKEINREVESVREEFDDHLVAINENTTEIENISNVLGELDEKIEKLNSRIDSIHMMFNQVMWQTKVSIELTDEEQKVFLILCNYKKYMKKSFIADKIRMQEQEINAHITSLADKGIPVIIRKIGGQVFLKLDPNFRKIQKKNKVVKINPAVAKQFENRTLESFFVHH